MVDMMLQAKCNVLTQVDLMFLIAELLSFTDLGGAAAELPEALDADLAPPENETPPANAASEGGVLPVADSAADPHQPARNPMLNMAMTLAVHPSRNSSPQSKKLNHRPHLTNDPFVLQHLAAASLPHILRTWLSEQKSKSESGHQSLHNSSYQNEKIGLPGPATLCNSAIEAAIDWWNAEPSHGPARAFIATIISRTTGQRPVVTRAERMSFQKRCQGSCTQKPCNPTLKNNQNIAE